MSTFAPDRAQGLRIGRVDALAYAGQGKASAEAYLEAKAHAAPEAAHEIEVRATEQYLFSGNLNEGRALLDRVLRTVGHSLPQTTSAALASATWSRARLRLRGLGFSPRAAHDPATLRELEHLRLAVHCLVRTDHLRAADFSARYVRRALDAGHAVEAARALAWELVFMSTLGRPADVIEAVRAQVRALCDETGDAEAAGWLDYCYGIYLQSRQQDMVSALPLFEGWIAQLDTMPYRTAVYDRAWGQAFHSMCLWATNHSIEAQREADVLLEDVRARGDYGVLGVAYTASGLAMLASDRVDALERLVQEARAALLPDEMTVHDMYWIMLRGQVSAYTSTSLQTWRQDAPYLKRYFASFQGRALAGPVKTLVAGWAADAARAAEGPTERSALVREVNRLLKSARGAPGTGGELMLPSPPSGHVWKATAREPWSSSAPHKYD